MRFRTAAAAVLALAAAAGVQAQDRALSYTTQQSEAGRTAYLASCVMCHGAHLSDGPLGKPL
jgi:cytochrome c5